MHFRLITVAALGVMLGSGNAAMAASALPGLEIGSTTDVHETALGKPCTGAGADNGFAGGAGLAQPGVPPLPNAYMTVNGSLFALGDALACARQLHRARVN